MKVANEYDIRQEVFLISDSEQLVRQVVYIVILDGGLIQYGLSCNGGVTDHYQFEITDSKNVV
jgi:hypothetical protein